jgi:D-serine deaminase-like pyridoxal phosphate-dependent protein
MTCALLADAATTGTQRLKTTHSNSSWFLVNNVEAVESPSLLIYPDRVDENIRRMVEVIKDPGRLRPHAKTHKLAEVASRQMAAGIKKFKSATIAEAEMLGRAGAPDVLLAYQPVGPNARRFMNLAQTFPQTVFSCLLDDLQVARELSTLATRSATTLNVLLDLDCGQHRTGIAPGPDAVALYQELCRLPGLRPVGLHAYDGHINNIDPVERNRACETAFGPVAMMREQLRALGLPGEILVCGGTPTFPIHAHRPEVECSPGTCVLWDYSYSSRLADLDFLHAALVLTRIVSKPASRRLCLDLGHKAIASENPHPRVHFLNAPSLRSVSHSEEHLVVETDSDTDLKVGDCLYGIPSHICPTVALYSEAVVIEAGKASAKWRIEARSRHLSI